ncbi:MAG: biotin/lipoyl-binding protein [Halieaceae bacterium]
MAEAGSELQLKALANLLLLQQRLREARSEPELGFILVNDTRTLVSYRSAVLWLTAPTMPGGGRLVSVSGAVEHDEHSPFLQWMKSLCREISERPMQGVAELRKADVSAALAGEWDVHGTEQLLWCPLYSGAGDFIGALALWRETPVQEAEQRILGNWLSAAGYSLAAIRGKAFARLKFAWTPGRKRIAAGIAALVLLLLFMPVRLSVLAQAEIVARKPLVVRSPLDGIISSIEVRPNVLVQEGALLMNLDDTELQTRLDVAQQTLAISRAQYQQAGQQAAFSAEAKASLRVLALEGEKNVAEVAYIKSLLERSAVEAEQGGVIIMPSPDEMLGRPVVTGERLLTIANPDDTQLEAWLTVGDDITLLYYSEIQFFPNVAPDKKYEARLLRMDYRADTIETGELAYRIRADFVDTEHLPRIGMRGTAKLHGESVSLGYYLLRRPLATLRRWTGF